MIKQSALKFLGGKKPKAFRHGTKKQREQYLNQKGKLFRKKGLREIVLKLAVEYAEKYPQMCDGRRIHGRINLEKRAQLTKKITQLIVRDRQLTGILLDARIDPMTQCKAIFQFALRKNNGDKKKAVLYLQKIIKTIRETVVGKKKKFYGFAIEFAKQNGVKTENYANYAGELFHTIASPLHLIVGILSTTIYIGQD